MYKALISGDPKWKKIASRTAGANRQAVRSAATRTIPAQGRHDAQPSAVVAADPDAGMITHTIPLGPGLRARLMLPEHLTMAQARRITAVVNSLAFEEDPSPGKEEVRAQDGE
jgi:hypothetical protein